MAYKPQQEEHEAIGHTESTVKQKAMNSPVRLAFSLNAFFCLLCTTS